MERRESAESKAIKELINVLVKRAEKGEKQAHDDLFVLWGYIERTAQSLDPERCQEK